MLIELVEDHELVDPPQPNVCAMELCTVCPTSSTCASSTSDPAAADARA